MRVWWVHCKIWLYTLLWVSLSLFHGAAVTGRRCVLISSSALRSQPPFFHICDFQDVAWPADGVWRWDFRKCLSLSHGEPLQGRWRADNPTARVKGLQTYRQTSAVESCCGVPSSGHPCERWQLLSMSSKCVLIQEWVTAWWFHPFASLKRHNNWNKS